MVDRAAYLEPSPYEVDAGELIGRHPGSLSRAELEALEGPRTVLKAIRAKCLDCVGGQPGEVRKCKMIDCLSWAFRMGRNPFDPRPCHQSCGL